VARLDHRLPLTSAIDSSRSDVGLHRPPGRRPTRTAGSRPVRVASPERVTVPTQDRVRGHDQLEVPQSDPWYVVHECGEERPVRAG